MVTPTSSISPFSTPCPAPIPQTESSSIGLAPVLLTAAAVTAASATVIAAALPRAARAHVWNVATGITGAIHDGGSGLIRTGIDGVVSGITAVSRFVNQWTASNAIEAHLKAAIEKRDQSNIAEKIQESSFSVRRTLDQRPTQYVTPERIITDARSRIVQANALIAEIQELPAEIFAIHAKAERLLDPSYRLRASLSSKVAQIETLAAEAQANIASARSQVQSMRDITKLTEIAFPLEINFEETKNHAAGVDLQHRLFKNAQTKPGQPIEAKLAELNKIRDAANTEATAAQEKATLAMKAYNDTVLPAFRTNTNPEIETKLREIEQKTATAQRQATTATALVSAMTNEITLLPAIGQIDKDLVTANALLSLVQKAQEITYTQRPRVLEEVIKNGGSLAQNLENARTEIRSIETQAKSVTVFFEQAQQIEVSLTALLQDNPSLNQRTKETEKIETIRKTLCLVKAGCNAVLEDFNVSKGHIEHASRITEPLNYLRSLVPQVESNKKSAQSVISNVKRELTTEGRTLSEKATKASEAAERGVVYVQASEASLQSANVHLKFLPDFLKTHPKQEPNTTELCHIRDHIDALTRETTDALNQARTLATEAARSADLEDQKNTQRATVRSAIQVWIANLRDINPTSRQAFIQQYEQLYTEIAAEIPQMIIEALRARREDILSEIALFQSGEATATTKAKIDAEITKSLEQIRVLRGTGFDGPIDAKWRTFFDAKQKEILAGAAVCSHAELTQSQISEILSIDPAQTDSLEALDAIGNRYKVSISREADSFADIAITADPVLRAAYDTQSKAQEAAHREYEFENSRYNTLCGAGFNPDTDITAEGICTVAEGTTIYKYQKQNADLGKEVTARLAFWQNIIAEITRTAPQTV